MATLSRSELVVLARAGAAHRIAELEAEIASIRRAFPGITASGSTPARRGPGRPPGPGRRRRRKMSAEGRKRISDMMKRRWAEHRKAARASK